VRSFRAGSAALAAGLIGALMAPSAQVVAAPECPATTADALGPFYRPDAPIRSKVGTGHVLRGTVRSSADCGAIPGARVELWLAGPNGYDDDHRATVFTDAAGRYLFESEQPRQYERRPPHIHVRVSHPGFRTLVTQQYPAKGAREETFDLVVAPAR
jgi:protocatechuate 3,4-dioxygenase beta subunit